MDAQRLKELRNNKNVTQNDVANFLGITRPAYTAYESGKREPDDKTKIKLADYFDVTVDYLLGRTNNRHEDILAAAHLDEDITKMSPEQRKAIYDFIEFQKRKIDEEKKD